MKDRTRAYMAGLMDAEGFFSIYEIDGRYEPRITLANKSLPLRKWLVKYFGGTCTNSVPPYFYWQLTGKQAMPAFLRSVLPHSRLKLEQILAMLEFFQVKETGDKTAQAALSERIKALKSESRNDRMVDGSAKDKTTHAYLAGFFDCCGYVAPMIIGVLGASMPILELFHRTYGGELLGDEWVVSDVKQREKFLLCALPYLQILRKQSLLVLQLTRLAETETDKQVALLRELVKLYNTEPEPMVQSQLHGDVQSEPEGTPAPQE